MAARGPGVWNVILALSLVYMPRTALLVRSTVLTLRELDYVQAARALGSRDAGVALRHILPNCMAPLLVQGTFIFAYAVLAEAILGFLGVGVPPYVPSWGNVIASGKNVIREAFWVSLFPGIALTVAGLSLNLLGDGLRDALDPRLRVQLPIWRFSRRRAFWILPLDVIGNSSTKTTSRGTLKLAMRPRHAARSSPAPTAAPAVR